VAIALGVAVFVLLDFFQQPAADDTRSGESPSADAVADTPEGGEAFESTPPQSNDQPPAEAPEPPEHAEPAESVDAAPAPSNPPILADWVFRYPEAQYQQGEASTDEAGRSNGSFAGLSDASVADVLSYYEDQMRAVGYAVTRQTTEAGVGGSASGILIGELDSPARSFIVSEQDGRTLINTQFDGINSQ